MLFLLAAVFFSLVVFIVWSISKYLIDISRTLFSILGVLGIFFGVLTLYSLKNLSSDNKILKATDRISFDDPTLMALQILTIATIGFMMICLLINVFKKRSVYFIVSFILVCLTVILVILAALTLRTYRRGTNPSNIKEGACVNNLAQINEASIMKFCPRKYLPETNKCRKTEEVGRWENKGERRSLDPSACIIGNAVLYWNAFLCNYWLFMMLACLCGMTTCCFFLSDTSEFLGIYYENTNMVMIISLLLGLLIATVGLVYVLFYSGVLSPSVNPQLWKMVAKKGEPNDPNF